MTLEEAVQEYAKDSTERFIRRHCAPIVGWLSQLHCGRLDDLTQRDLLEAQQLLYRAVKRAQREREVPALAASVETLLVVRLSIREGSIVNDVEPLTSALVVTGRRFVALREEFITEVLQAPQSERLNDTTLMQTAWQALREALRRFNVKCGDKGYVVLECRRGVLTVDMTALAQHILCVQQREDADWMAALACFRVGSVQPSRLSLVR